MGQTTGLIIHYSLKNKYVFRIIKDLLLSVKIFNSVLRVLINKRVCDIDAGFR
jgi:hypothetical protein